MAVKLSKVKNIKIYSIIAIAILGVSTLFISNAATFSVSIKPQPQGDCVKSITDSTASGGSAIQFCTASTNPGASAPGAKLPLQYDLASLTGTVRFVATNGSDSNAGTIASPYATLSKAVSSSASNDTIVVRGGTYRAQRNINVSKSGLKIKAYPGETPEFKDSTSVNGGWTTEGSYKYISYTPRPLSESQGVPFNDLNEDYNLITGGEKGVGVGRYPDQAWIGDNELRQVDAKSYLADGKFWVDRSNNRLYLTATDAGKSNIEVSPNVTDSKYYFLEINKTGVSIEGIKVVRYSTLAKQQGAILINPEGDDFKLNHVVVLDIPFIGIKVNEADNVKFTNITMGKVGWQTIDTLKTDNFTLDSSVINDNDYFEEFSSSPASGAIKTGQNRGTTISNSSFSKNLSHAVWFDQSNINSTVANNTFIDNGDSSIFFEISDGLTLVNNYFRAYDAEKTVRAIGSSGVVAVNNTIVGGGSPFTVSVDDRSHPGCQLDSGCYHYSSDVQQRFPIPATLDWMPRLDIFINNIVAYPTGGSDLCGKSIKTLVCFMTYHSQNGRYKPIETIIHKADSSRGIPQTAIGGNVYANGSGVLFRVTDPSVNYSSLSSWSSAMAGAPVNIAGIDASTSSKAGDSWVSADGTPTSALSAKHSEATSVPVHAEINKWIPAGTKHYGVTYK